MAERRMFSKKIVQSGRFLKMPATTRELYFQLGMSADDDGIVEAWNVMNFTNAREDDLRVLIAKGYIQILDNEDLIAYLNDWDVNNQIRKDRYHESIYTELKLKIRKDQREIIASASDWKPADEQMATDGKPNGNQMETEVRLGKDSIGKDNNNNMSTEADEIDEAFEKIYAIYPKKVGKTKAKARHRQWLKGRKVNGKTVKLTNAQIWTAVAKYVRSKEDSELRFYKDFNVLLGDCLLDYVEDEE